MHFLRDETMRLQKAGYTMLWTLQLPSGQRMHESIEVIKQGGKVPVLYQVWYQARIIIVQFILINICVENSKYICIKLAECW